MFLNRPWTKIVFGVLLVLLGILWTLQGMDVLGQDGGMNGRLEWVLIGGFAFLIGLILIGNGAWKLKSE